MNNKTVTAWIQDAEEEYAPPMQNVLGVDVVGNRVFLTIAKVVNEGAASITYETVADVAVDIGTLIRTIAVCVGATNVQISIPEESE